MISTLESGCTQNPAVLRTNLISSSTSLLRLFSDFSSFFLIFNDDVRHFSFLFYFIFHFFWGGRGVGGGGGGGARKALTFAREC